MPRLRKSSQLQRLASARNRVQVLRTDPDYRVREQLQNTQNRAIRRQDITYRDLERQSDSIRRSERRANLQYREIEQERDTVQHTMNRQDPEYRVREQHRDRQQHAILRENEEYRTTEQNRNTQEHIRRRQNTEYRETEQERDRQQHAIHRENEEYRTIEQNRNTQEHIRRRQNVVYRDREQQRDRQQRALLRENEEYHNAEQNRNTQEHIRRRQNTEYRETEQERDRQQRAIHRENEEYRTTEQNRNTQEHIRRRQNVENREIEQTRNTIQRRHSRIQARHLRQNLQRMASCRVMLFRCDVDNRRREMTRQSERRRAVRETISLEEVEERREIENRRRRNLKYQNYNQLIKQGPTVICNCCGGLWFLKQTEIIDKSRFGNSHPFVNEVFALSAKFPSVNNKYTFCRTCSRLIKTNKKPNLCLANGLEYPHLPDCLKDLTSVEERLVSARLPFMRIVSLGFERQSAIRGAVVNVPITVNQTVTSLPRTFDEAAVVQLHLKRRMEYSHDYMTETVRPAKVLAAITYLVTTELYRKHGIHIDESWFSRFPNLEEVPFVAAEIDEPTAQELFNRQSERNSFVPDPNNEVVENQFSPDRLNPGGQQTLLENIPAENVALQRIIMAPGEGQRPMDMILDEDSEELSFVTIYGGEKRNCSETYSHIVRSELRNYDRRGCRIDKLLYNYKKLELINIKNSTSICLRKRSSINNITASNALNEDFLNNLIHHDDGYRVLKGVRSSPAHWEAEKKKVLAMIRQFGLPTFFITFSAAETKWTELLVILAKTIDNLDISEEQASNLTFEDKARLIRMDSVTCARYFDFRFRQLFNLLKMEGGVFNNNFVEKFYWRVEFQHRGSPHVHGMYWLKDAPRADLHNPDSNSPVIEFIDRFVSTNGADPNLQEFLPFQKHHHTQSCLREIRGQRICRYGMPYPPMPRTEILTPLPDDTQDLAAHKNNYDKIQSLINANLSPDDISALNNFDNCLSKLNISYEQYKLALRSNLKKPHIYLRRKFEDKLLNAYNPSMLSLHRANMDIQFILDAYACCSYIVNYINKSNRGVSRLLRDAMDEINAGNFSIKQKLQHIGHKFINGTEISAQEAAYCCLGMHLSESSNAEIYINTARPEQRVKMLKSRNELQNLPSDSTSIFVAGLLEHYVQRPEELQDICLADFSANYRFSKSLRANEPEEIYEENTEHPQNESANIYFRLKDNSGYIRKRTKPCVIRYRKYNVDTDRNEYFRELVMLYFPWRNEETDLIDNDNEHTCNRFLDIIEHNRRKYDVFEERELENVLTRLQEEVGRTEGGHVEDDHPIDEEFRIFAVPDVRTDINILNINDDNEREDNSEGGIHIVKLPPLIPDQEFLPLIRSLNVRQKTYLAHLLHNVNSKTVFHEYIGGGAGVGKSRLISAIYQSLNKRFYSVPGNNPNLIKVLLCAPTGKAAFGIGGQTLHSMFSLPVNQSSSNIRPLSHDTANSLHCKLIELKVLIIDEISMVGAKMLAYLDARLKQIFKSTASFGGISIIVFGDLKQLPPVGDRWIFSHNPNDNYGAISGTALWDLFKYFELTEVMRQREDQTFAIALNNMAEGKMTEADIALIKSRIVSNANDIPNEAIHLFWSNEETDNYNNLKLGQIPSEEIIAIGTDVVKAAELTRQNRERILDAVKSFRVSETQGLPHKLILKTTAKYMVTVNVNTSDGLVNGASGQLMHIDFRNTASGRQPSTIWIKFADETVGRIARSHKPHPQEPSWTPFDRVMRSFQYKRNDQVCIDRKQFPVIPAEGITIHKSQGATYSQVVVHTRPRMNRASLYVACSRATAASGLYISGSFIPPKPFSENDVVQIEMTRLRTEKPIQLHFDSLRNSRSFNLIYHNVQSLHSHIEDVRNDNLMAKSDIMCFVETWTMHSENYDIPGFRVLPNMRLDSAENYSRSKRGIIIYVKNAIADSVRYCFSKQIHSSNQTFEVIIFNYKDIDFVILYRNSSFPIRSLRTELNNAFNSTQYLNGKVVVLGDFNICRRTGSNHIDNIFTDRGLTSLLDLQTNTTVGGTHIDWALSNIDNGAISAEIYETIYSYHDAVCVNIPNL